MEVDPEVDVDHLDLNSQLANGGMLMLLPGHVPAIYKHGLLSEFCGCGEHPNSRTSGHQDIGTPEH